YKVIGRVADERSEQGISPTIEKVRQELGASSISTISKYLNEWKSQRLMASTDTSSQKNAPSDPINETLWAYKEGSEQQSNALQRMLRVITLQINLAITKE